MKKMLSFILSLMLILSIFTVMPVSAQSNETEILGPSVNDSTLPEIAEGCNRYFFYMPKIWENEYTQTAGIYWWEGTGAHESWPGVEANKADVEGLYYYDVPKDVWAVIWNNFLDGGMNFDSPEYKAAQRSGYVCTEYYEAGESPLYPEGLESFNNMVYVINFDECNCNDLVEPHTFGGDWYYYYGNGEYGTTPEKGEVVYTERYRGDINSHNKGSDSEPLPEVAEGCNRYFFYMPDEWYNEYATDGPGIYWDNGVSSSDVYPGTPLLPTDTVGVFYYDVPESVEEVLFTNLLDGGEDFTNPIFASALSAPSFPINADENYSLADCDGKIFVLHFAFTDYDDYTAKATFHGVWFYYYGDGEYGATPVRGDGTIYSGDKMDGHLYYVGDADNNGVVNVKDATAIQKHLADIATCRVIAADVDGNGLNIKDATAIQKYLAGIETNLKIDTVRFY